MFAVLVTFDFATNLSSFEFLAVASLAGEKETRTITRAAHSKHCGRMFWMNKLREPKTNGSLFNQLARLLKDGRD